MLSNICYLLRPHEKINGYIVILMDSNNPPGNYLYSNFGCGRSLLATFVLITEERGAQLGLSLAF